MIMSTQLQTAFVACMFVPEIAHYAFLQSIRLTLRKDRYVNAARLTSSIHACILIKGLWIVGRFITTS